MTAEKIATTEDHSAVTLEQLVAENARLAARLERLEAKPVAAAGSERVSRRRLFGWLGGAAVAGVGGAILTAAPAGANDPNDVVLGAVGQSASAGITSSNASRTFQVDNSSTGNGVTASTTSGNGVIGDVSGSGVGVSGTSTNGSGVLATSSTGNSVQVSAPTFNSAGAHLLLVPSGSAGPPTAGAHTLGQFWVDSAGVLFQCVVAGTPGTWVRQAPLVTLAAPSRVYDSRAGQPNPSGSPQGSLAFGAAARTINCSPAVPAGATTILFNLAATGTAGPGAGALLVWAAGASEPLASSINWSTAGQTLANSVTSGCNGSQDVQVKCVASAGSSTQFILDVIGYYF